MTKEEFEKLADEYGVDTYGEIDSECGWGICFAFELSEALHFYLPENWESQDDEKYSAYCLLDREYKNVYQTETEEGGIADMLYTDMNNDPNLWEKLFEAWKFAISLF